MKSEHCSVEKSKTIKLALYHLYKLNWTLKNGCTILNRKLFVKHGDRREKGEADFKTSEKGKVIWIEIRLHLSRNVILDLYLSQIFVGYNSKNGVEIKAHINIACLQTKHEHDL